MAIRLLSKGSLCIIFGEYARGSMKNYYGKLRQYYFTNEVLSEIGITPDRYDEIKGGQTFTFHESRQIIDYFKITEDELTELQPSMT